MLFDAQTTQYVAIAGAGLGLVGFGVGIGSAFGLRRLRRSYAGVAKSASAGDLLETIADQHQLTRDLRTEVGRLQADVTAARADLADAIRHVAVVRYDAFDDMGGRLSFSAALLDDSGDGLVLTAIHARSETRSYAKGIKATVSTLPLSPEEQQAIAYAYRAAPQGRSPGRHASAPAEDS